MSGHGQTQTDMIVKKTILVVQLSFEGLISADNNLIKS